MCTVTFVPTGPNSYILTSNRDESPARATEGPGKEVSINELHSAVFPKDSLAGGTWIAMSKKNRTTCLLNGAYIKHKHSPPYRKSRGLILLEYFESEDAFAFAKNVMLENIEPFTLVIVEEERLFDFRWDGAEKSFKELSRSEGHIWSSCTLYTKEVADEKEARFRKWLSAKTHFNAADTLYFHGLNNPPGYLLDLPQVRTVSITAVENDGIGAAMYYNDLLDNSALETKISFVEHATERQ